MAEPVPAHIDVGRTQLSTAGRLLRQQTADSHRLVEERLGLLESLSAARLLFAVATLHGFWCGTEPAVDAWFARHPETAEALQWTRRARAERHRHDLSVLAEACAVPTPVPAAAPPVFADVDEAAVLGWLYVAEGSTLGGAVIDAAVRRAGLPAGLLSFTPYPEGPQPMWRSYLAHLEAWTSGGAARTDLVVAAGVAVFASLERWVADAVTAEAA